MLRHFARILCAASVMLAGVLASNLAFGQSSGSYGGDYGAYLPGSSDGYGYGVYGGGHASTAAEGYLRGWADLTRGQGLYNL